MASKFGVELTLNGDWANVDLAGKDAESTTAFAPQLGLLYGMSEQFDLALTLKYSTLDVYDSDTTVTRIGGGSRYWIAADWSAKPFVGLMFTYYLLDNDDFQDSTDTIGITGEAGVAWTVNDWLLVKVNAQAESTIQDATVKFGGRERDVSMWTIGAGAGAAVVF
jgi:hypothetical protein